MPGFLAPAWLQHLPGPPDTLPPPLLAVEQDWWGKHKIFIGDAFPPGEEGRRAPVQDVGIVVLPTAARSQLFPCALSCTREAASQLSC